MPRPHINRIDIRKKIIDSLSDIIDNYVDNKSESDSLAEYAFDHLDIFDPYSMAYGLQKKKKIFWGQELPHPSDIKIEDRYDYGIYDDLVYGFNPDYIYIKEVVMWVAENEVKPSHKVGDLVGYMGSFVPVVEINEEIAEYTLLYKNERVKIPVEVLERD